MATKDSNVLSSVVGVDIGRSGVKISFFFSGENKENFIPSVVIPAKKLTFDSNKKQTENDTVVVDGREYFVGQTAIEQGGSQTVGLSDNWLEGNEHKALLKRAQKLLISYGVVPKLVVVGLPIKTFQSHLNVLCKQVEEVFKSKVVSVPQPWGVYQDFLLTDKGLVKKTSLGSLKEKIAIIDVGHYTTDIMLMNGMSWIQEGSGSAVGMYKAVDKMRDKLTEEGINATTLECQNYMITRQMKEFGKIRDIGEIVDECFPSTVEEVVQVSRNLLEAHARNIDHILIAGGGAEPLYKRLKELWPQSELIEEARFSVVRGMRKYGISLALSDNKLIT